MSPISTYPTEIMHRNHNAKKTHLVKESEYSNKGFIRVCKTFHPFFPLNLLPVFSAARAIKCLKFGKFNLECHSWLCKLALRAKLVVCVDGETSESAIIL